MKPILSCIKKGGVTAIALTAMTSLAQIPSEQGSAKVLRDANSALVLQTSLSKNYFRSEPYQASYEEQVPYQVQETYTDYETDYVQENRCHTEYSNECHSERQCRSVPDRQCRNEQVCTEVPGGRGSPNCRTATECGTTSAGQPICKERQVCDNGTVLPGHRECRNETRCDNWGSREECSYQNVCREVPRQVCRLESVPHQRPVTRTRTVTKYRSETRCCRTEYRSVFDHQQQLDVVLNFPAGSELVMGEDESFLITLAGNEAAPSILFRALKQMNQYRVLSQSIQGHTITVQIESTPLPIDLQAVGANSVSGLRLKIMEDNTGIVVFEDNGQIGRLRTQYNLVIKNGGGAIIHTQTVAYSGQPQHRITLDRKLSLQDDHTLEMTVQRSGPGVASVIEFKKSFFRAK